MSQVYGAYERRRDAIRSALRGPERQNFRNCTACDRPGRLTNGAEIYPNKPELADNLIWKCDGCEARVGCHPGTTTPLGRMANAKLRAAKMAAHAAFDPLWRRLIVKKKIKPGQARTEGYRWLAEQLGIDPRDCHVGHFDLETCRRVVEICGRSRP